MSKGDGRMNNPEQVNVKSEHSEGTTPRRPYVKPEFSCERVFESTALGCNHFGGTSPT